MGKVLSLGDARDLAFMKSPEKWPKWPYLPIKRTVLEEDTGFHNTECGFLVAGKKAEVFRENLFRVVSERIPLSTLKSHVYSDLDGLLKDGWIVD